MDWKNFTNAILEGARSSAPESSNAALGNSFTGAFRNAATRIAGRAQGVTAQRNADDDEREREAARRREIQRLQDRIDPSKYQKLRKDDGGFAFFDPEGKEIDVDTFAKRTGQRRIDVLRDSENPLDQQFIDDYMQMNEVNQAVWRNDGAAVSEYMSTFPDVFQGDRPPTPEELNKKLLEKYPHIFGMGQYERSYSNLGKPVFRSGFNMSGGGTGGRRSNFQL